MRLSRSYQITAKQLLTFVLTICLFITSKPCDAQTQKTTSTPVALAPAIAKSEGTHSDNIVQQEYKDATSGATTPYLLYNPAIETPPAKRSLLIFLYGAGGSIKNYNFKRKPYASLRKQLAHRGYYVMVPELGKLHFMNDAAKSKVDGVVTQVLKQQQIPTSRVHIMGTSMGGGSSLAYAIHRPNLIRSVCAVVPMTDFSLWTSEIPRYSIPVANAFGGTPQQVPHIYDRNSATKNIDAFAKTPVMLVHGTADRIVFYEHSQKLAKMLKVKNYACQLYTVKNMTHKDDVMQDFQIQAADFFDAAVK